MKTSAFLLLALQTCACAQSVLPAPPATFKNQAFDKMKGNGAAAQAPEFHGAAPVANVVVPAQSKVLSSYAELAALRKENETLKALNKTLEEQVAVLEAELKRKR
jgi:hypothetical protein